RQRPFWLGQRLDYSFAERRARDLLRVAQTAGNRLRLASRRLSRFNSVVPGNLCALPTADIAAIFSNGNDDSSRRNAVAFSVRRDFWAIAEIRRLDSRRRLWIFSVERIARLIMSYCNICNGKTSSSIRLKLQ